MTQMRILGIETSCDETAAAVVEDGRYLISNVVASSARLHVPYGGVIPEIAARSQLESIVPVINEAVTAVGGWDGIDAIAVTQGPGLIGSLLIGGLSARSLALLRNKPLYSVNHVQAHPYAAFIEKTKLPGYKLKAQPRFPYLALIVSGGHTQLVIYKSHHNYRLLGQTTDDAVGEAFDKVAKVLGLPYPGGPSVNTAAKKGRAGNVLLPDVTPKSGCDFSFSGLKTAVLRAGQSLAGKDFTLPSSALSGLLSVSQKQDLAAAFQDRAITALTATLERAAKEYRPTDIVVAGGVAANVALRAALDRLPTPVIYPDIKLCTDNAAMVASLAYYQRQKADPLKLGVEPNLSM